MLCEVVDWSAGWATPRGSASQMRPCSEAKRLIGRPQESAQPERKSTPRYANKFDFYRVVHKNLRYPYKILIIIFYTIIIERKMIMEDIILQTENLSKSFKGQKIVEDLSLTIPRNTVYGLLGPNGAGKSTALKMITGMLRPNAGKILFNGREWNRNDLKDIGVLIETPPLYENLTARENLKVRTIALGLPESRIDEVLRIVDLTNTGKKRAGQFSLGMKQRLGIAIALLNYPKLLILDEPTNGLDPIGIQELRKLIRSFPEQGITVILSSHILSEVEQVVDEIGIIAGGKIGYQGAAPQGQELESLFMQVVSTNRKAGM